MRFAIVLGLAGLLCSSAALVAGAKRAESDPATGLPTIAATPIGPSAEAIRLNGELTESIWTSIPAVTDFFQRDPREGAPATHRTSVKVAYDDRALYVAVQAVEPDAGEVVGMLTRRDETSPSDWLRVMVDSYRDGRTAYEFAVNAAGVKQDRYWFGDTSNDPGWDAVWDVAVSRHGDGWSAEFRIPFSQLRFNPAAGSVFGFAVVREVAHLKETDTWPLLARSATGFVSSFGQLTGLSFGRAPRKVELLPYGVAQTTTAPVNPANPLRTSPDSTASAGLDVKAALGGGLTLTGTVNPDFGQVEADPAVVNLTGFETFFAERRPFFVEGSGNFAFNIDCNDGQCTGLFYSRRIGRAPHLSVPAPPGGYAAQPASSTIAAAAKVTGRIGAFSVGVLDAVTTREDARLVGPTGGVPSTTPVEPLSNYTVARLSREFANRSRLSFALTNTARQLTDTLQSIPRSATTGGVDADWRLGGVYSLSGYWAGSAVRGSAEAIDLVQTNSVHAFQRPDSARLAYDPTRESLEGHAGSLNFSKIGGLRTRFNTFVGYKTPGFDINDLGYVQRADAISQSNWFQIRSDQPTRHFRSRNVNFNQWTGWNFDGDRRYLGANVNSHYTLVSNWQFGGGVSANAQGVSDRVTRGGPVVYTTPNLSGWIYVNTDNRRTVSASVNVNGFGDRYGSHEVSVAPTVAVRPSRALLLTLGFGVDRNLAQSQWVENVVDADGTTHYVFGRLDQTTVSVSARVNYTLTPTLSVQIYAQPFVSAGAYSRFKELANGRADDYADRYAVFAYGGHPDFNVRSFRTTNVLRWEYHPGSVLFVVWQQGRGDVLGVGDFRFGRDFTGLFDAPATNLLLIKVSRWFSL